MPTNLSNAAPAPRVERRERPRESFQQTFGSLSDRATPLNLDLGPELHHLLGRHAEEGGGALGVALQEGKQRFPPHPHARDILARDDGLAADVIGDVAEVDARQLALLAGEDQPLVDRRILHEAVMQDDAGYARDDFDDLGAILVGYARGLLDQHGHQHHALMQYM